MNVPERINDYITRNVPQAFCDGCIDRALGLGDPKAAQANTVTNSLATTAEFERYEGTCDGCGKELKVTRRGEVVRYRITFERDARKPHPPDGVEKPEEWIGDNLEEAKKIAHEMANRPGKSGGSVIICVWRLPKLDLILVEPGDSMERIEQEILARFTGETTT